MTNNDDEELEEDILNSPIGPGELIAFGNLNLILTLNLDENDLSKYKVNWNDINSLKDLKFIRKHHHFWKRVELSSNNETMKLLLNINKTSPKLIYIGYVVLKKIIFKGEQNDFKKHLYYVLKKRGLFIKSCDICDCSINVQLILKYQKDEKAFPLVEESKCKNIEIKNKKKYEEDKEDNTNTEKEKEKDNTSKLNDEEEKNSKSNNTDNSEYNNPFIGILKNGINCGDFDFIYFNFNDYISGEFKGKIKLENLFEYFQDIKIRTNTKIILNFEENIEIFRDKNREEIFKDLLSITDFFIFYNMNKLYEVLKELKENEDQEIIDESFRVQCFKYQKKILDRKKIKEKEETWAKNYKKFIENSREKKISLINPKSLKKYINNKPINKIYITQEYTYNNETTDINDIINNTENNNNLETVENTIMNPNNQIKTETFDNGNESKNLINQKSKSETVRYSNLFPIKPSKPKPLNKTEMFNYFKNSLFDHNPQKKPSDKILLVLDEFNKIYIIKCIKYFSKPIVMDCDLKLYPQMNIRNMKDILNYKKFIRSKFNEYISIFIGALLGILVSKGDGAYKEGNLFISYLIAINIIKKIAELQRFDLPLPKNKEFFYPSLTKEEIDKMLSDIDKRKKENGFVLDGNDKKIKKLKVYNPLLDKNLSSYLNSKNNKIILKSNGVIGKDGKIIYDPTYRDTLGFNTMRNKNKISNFLFNSDSKRSNKNFKSLANETNKLMVGFRNISPGYSVYIKKNKKLNNNNNYNYNYNNKIVLPIIKNNKKFKIKNEFKDEKEKIIVEKSEESGSVGENDSGKSDNNENEENKNKDE